MQNQQNGRKDVSIVGVYGGYLRREVYPKAVEMVRDGLAQDEIDLIRRKVRRKVNESGHFGRLIGELQELALSGNLRATDGQREDIGLAVVELVAGRNSADNLEAFMDVMDAIDRKFAKFNRPAVEKLLAAYCEWLKTHDENSALKVARERLDGWVKSKNKGVREEVAPIAQVLTQCTTPVPVKEAVVTEDVAELKAEAERLNAEAATCFDADDKALYKKGLLLELEAINLEEKIEGLGVRNETNGALPRGLLKMTPDCFVVQELIGNPATPVPLCNKSAIWGWDHQVTSTVFNMTKVGYTTMDALREVARQLGVPEEVCICHGLKDRHAHTSQLISIRGEFKPQFSHPQIFLRQLDRRRFSISGLHAGNRFSIYIVSGAKSVNLDGARQVSNFFGSQRLGKPGEEVSGRLLLEGDYNGAARVVLKTPSAERLRSAERSAGSWKGAFLHPSSKFSFEFLIQKWQSFLWNELLEEKLGNGGVPERLPMWSPANRDLYRHLWDPQQVLDEHAVKRIREFDRPTTIEPGDLQAEQNLIGWHVRFDLPPGAYATVVLSKIFDIEERHV
jgi:tRNA(Glu) U13 pseudouridine synthase TruD